MQTDVSSLCGIVSVSVSVVTVYFVDWILTTFMYLLLILLGLLFGTRPRGVNFVPILCKNTKSTNVIIPGHAHLYRNLVTQYYGVGGWEMYIWGQGLEPTLVQCRVNQQRSSLVFEPHDETPKRVFVLCLAFIFIGRAMFVFVAPCTNWPSSWQLPQTKAIFYHYSDFSGEGTSKPNLVFSRAQITKNQHRTVLKIWSINFIQ